MLNTDYVSSGTAPAQFNNKQAFPSRSNALPISEDFALTSDPLLDVPADADKTWALKTCQLYGVQSCLVLLEKINLDFPLRRKSSCVPPKMKNLCNVNTGSEGLLTTPAAPTQHSGADDDFPFFASLYDCKVCSKSFYTEEYLEYHTSIFHATEYSALPYVCDVCGRRFRVKSFLVLHMENHAGKHAENHARNHVVTQVQNHAKKQLKNNVETRVLNHDEVHVQNNVENHIQNNVETHVLNHVENHMQNHVETHVQNNVEINVQTHMESHATLDTASSRSSCTGPPPGKDAPECRPTALGVEPQLPSEKPFVCAECGRAFRLSCHRASHHRLAHEPRASKAVKVRTETSQCLTELDKPYSCEICGKRYKWRNSLRTHVKSHISGEKQPDNAGETSKLRASNDSSKSSECFAETEGQMSLDVETPCAQLKKLEKPFACSVCGRRFALKRTMRHHLREKHSKLENPRPSGLLKQFACGLCEKTFRYRSILALHQEVHSMRANSQNPTDRETKPKSLRRVTKRDLLSFQDKPFACNVCEKKFTWKYNLNQHEKTHNRNQTQVNVNRSSDEQVPLMGGSENSSKMVKSLNPVSRTAVAKHKVSVTFAKRKRGKNREKLFFCGLCHTGFVIQFNLERHQKRYCKGVRQLDTGEDLCDVEPVKSAGGPVKSAGGPVKSSGDTTESQRPFACPHCDQEFKGAFRLRRHAVIHTRRAAHPCGSCTSSFCTSTLLRVHQERYCLSRGTSTLPALSPDPVPRLLRASMPSLMPPLSPAPIPALTPAPMPDLTPAPMLAATSSTMPPLSPAPMPLLSPVSMLALTPAPMSLSMPALSPAPPLVPALPRPQSLPRRKGLGWTRRRPRRRRTGTELDRILAEMAVNFDGEALYPPRPRRGASCLRCGGLELASVWELVKHNKQHHSKARWPCQQCGATFRYRAGLGGHMQTHADNTRLTRARAAEEPSESPCPESAEAAPDTVAETAAAETTAAAATAVSPSDLSISSDATIIGDVRGSSSGVSLAAVAAGAGDLAGALSQAGLVPAGPHLCPHCPARFHLRLLLQSHLRLHTRRAYECSDCGFKASCHVARTVHFLQNH